jgi:hypothetical protein
MSHRTQRLQLLGERKLDRMMSLKRSVLLALMLMSVVVVAASPAFATPNITASSGSRPVSPFVTPIGNTSTSSSDGLSTDSRLSIGGTDVACRTANARGYVDVTHTNVKLTSVTFGDGRGGTCSATGGGRVDGDSIDGGATSARPWHLHVRTVDAATRSATGTVNTSSAVTFVVTVPIAGASCQFTVPAGQSVPAVYTFGNTSLAVDGTVTTNIVPVRDPIRVCPRSGTATYRATYTIRPSPAPLGTRNSRLSVTAVS